MAPTAPSILDLPVDDRDDPSLLHLNRLIYIPETGIWAASKKVTPIFDYTKYFDRSTQSWFTDDYVGFKAELLARAKRLASSSADGRDPAIRYKLSRAHWYNDTRLTVTKPETQCDEDEAEDGGESSSARPFLAEYQSPLLGYGVTHLTFPPGSQHSSHEITVRPLNATRRTQGWVQDSVRYAWDVNRRLFPGGGGVLSLWKAIGSTQKIEIGRYQSETGKFMPGGMMAVDEDEIDLLVAVLTCLAVLGQRDSFNYPTGKHAM
jgi:hypothetical protein